MGGANLKVVTDSGADIHYCPLWQESPITEVLSPYSGTSAAVVMSGETRKYGNIIIKKGVINR